MTARRRVLIFDDEFSSRQAWADGLREIPEVNELFEITVAEDKAFEASLEILKNRRKASRGGQQGSGEQSLFDTADVLIVDYDLFALDETGEEVAYLARCYSECGVVVALNQFAREGFTFDLTLKGHPESFADINLLADQIVISGLWSDRWENFRPWHWPHLPRVIASLGLRASDLSGRLDEPIVQYFQFPPQILDILPVGVLEFIGDTSTTFRQFVNDSGRALRGQRDNVISDGSIARIAAARLSKWLERVVLPGQNILIDAAHLLERYPSLSGVSAEQLVEPGFSYRLLQPDESTMKVGLLERFQFARPEWLSRTAWYWPMVSECDEIAEVSDPWSHRPDLAFCEDTSTFVRTAEAHEFVARVESPFVRRFVSRLDPRYGPALQLAL